MPDSTVNPVGELSNGDTVWPGPTYLIRIHGDPEHMVETDICDAIQNHYNVLAIVERSPSVPCGCHATCGDDGDIDGPGTCKRLPRA